MSTGNSVPRACHVRAGLHAFNSCTDFNSDAATQHLAAAAARWAALPGHMNSGGVSWG